MDNYLEWLRIAKSNLNIGKSYHRLLDEDIRFEELCFELQQCVEKSLKALILYNNESFPRTHNIAELLILVKQNIKIQIPDNIKLAAKLTQYAVQTRYPDDFSSIEEQEYNQAIEIAENVYNWVKEQVK